MHLYRGDVVRTDRNTRLVVREVDGGRVKIQVGADWCWVWADDLKWDGESLIKLPRTERGWRKLGKLMRGNS